MKQANPLYQRIISIVLCMAMLLAYMPQMAQRSYAAQALSGRTDIVSDSGTAHTWETMMGTAIDGNRYAGRVWADKSVYTDGQTAVLSTSGAPGSSFQVALEEDEAFQLIFSVLGSSMTTTTTNSYVGPMDVVLVLDTSTSMAQTSGGVSRLQRTMEAANKLLEDLLTIPDVRIAIVTYNADSETVLELDAYTNGITLSTNSYTNTNGGGIITARDDDNNLLGRDDGYHTGTNLQSGIDRGFRILANAENISGRIPVAIVLTDGEANRAVTSNWYNVSAGRVSSSGTTGIALSTLLNAAYGRASIEKHYGKAPMIYGIGVELSSGGLGQALMNPAAANGFSSGNSSSSVRAAYDLFLEWASGSTVKSNNNSYTFDHNLPATPGITSAEVAANIHYVDTYFNVTSANLGITFTQIYEELTSGAFNPISSSQTVTGGTGVENTPLIYVDHIGQHMEVKRIQSVTLFGASFTVIHNPDGTYTVTEATGVNPTTNENYNTAEDIRISVTENEDGTQTLRVEIDQEILPILLEQVLSETVGGKTHATINELTYAPLRVFYTVGLDSDIFLPTGEIDVNKLADDYSYINDAIGEISFYSNRFGSVNKINGEGAPYVERLDAHVGFKPSEANRYYYHQSNVDIYTSVTAKSGTISWDASEYGVLETEDAYDFVHMTYADYQAMLDSNPTVYTKVTYYRPTSDATDAANAAEAVTYIVYTQWQYLKESVAFYDVNAGTYINYAAGSGYTTGDKGYAIPVDKVAATISAYQTANPAADIQVELGIGSLRTSRLHNMTVAKEANVTGTAELRYAPEYTYETAVNHSGNDVVVWLGNNGKLTTTISTGIALTKRVTEAIGNADDTYALTVTIPSGVSATPVVKNALGEDVTAAISTYVGNVLTVNLKAGETVYISGIPVGTVCAIGEVIQGDYYIESQTTSVTVPTLSQVLAGAEQYVPATVTNAPHKYGNLYITKEMTSDHAIATGVLTQEFALKVFVGADLAGQSFSVKKGNLDTPGMETTTTETVDAEGNLNLTIQARQTVEILNLPEGIPVVITEEMTAQQQAIFTASYRTRNHSGMEADADNTVTIPAGGNATAVITNKYTPQPTSVDLDIAGTKNFQAESGASLAGGSFTFLLQKWNGSAWEDMTSTVTTYAAGESGIKTFLLEDVLQGISYTEVGTWSYQVLEVEGSLENLTYDRTLYTFTVTVTDNGGQLVAVVTDVNNTEITDGSYEVTFTNTYHTAPVSIDVVKDVVNHSGDDTVSKAGFAFQAVQTDENWNALAGSAALTVYSDAAGKARFTVTYTDAGTYYYLVSEVAGTSPGWTYSGAQYRVTVTVTELEGNLTSMITIEAVAGTTVTGEQATVAGNNGTVSFVNIYDPVDATVNLNTAVKKNLSGKALAANAFTFKVYENGTTVTVLTGTNDAFGNVTFDGALSFDKAGKYAYDIAEVIPTEAVYDSATGKYTLHGMTYDTTIFDLVVEVTNNSATGQLEAVYYFEDSTLDSVTFRNVYTVTPTSYTFSGTKLLTGRAMSAGEFSFQLYEGETLLETVTNKADGSFSFSALNYTAAGTYTYTVREVAGSAPGVSYTGASNPITVTVTVTDTNGVLSAAADVANADIRFENTYTANAATVTFDGVKVLAGAVLADHSFTFRLYQTDSTFDLTRATLLETVQNVSGRYSFTSLQFNRTGTFFYAIVEDATVDPMPDVVYDSTVHRFRVQVSDLGDGQLTVEVQDLNAGTTSAAASAMVVSTGFTNAVFDEVTEKQVYLAGNTATQIDGQKVNPGDILEYHITYTNYTGQDVTVEITDTIPAYTVYVEGSASHGGSYVGNHISWAVHVAKGESITVSFRVEVADADSVVSNTAVVRDGVNTYTTNAVTNHTVEEVAQKDVFLADDPDVSIDGRQVAMGDVLQYTIRFTNTTDQAVSLVITDAVPAHTVYVEGSASHGGIFADGVLTWTLQDVAAWSTVEVSFRVTVTATESVVIENQAIVQEGSNTYTTNPTANPHTPETTGLTITKTWDDNNNQDGKRPNSITVHVYGNGKLVTSVQLTAANGWQYTLKDLDLYENGSEIVYTITEDAVAGYTTEINGFHVTNRYTPETMQVSGSKTWDDNNNQDGKRPDSIVINLLADGTLVASKTVTAADGWSWTFENLDVYRDGRKIVYTITEDAVAGYTTEINGFHVTNRYIPETTAVTVSKVWDDADNQDGKRPASIVVHLLADGVHTGLTVTLSAENNWSHTWNALNKYADGDVINYTVYEEAVAEYTTTYNRDSANDGHVIITNRYVPEKTAFTVQKLWQDNHNQDGIRPASVTVALYANGVATGITAVLSGENHWRFTFEDLDKMAAGQPVVYTVVETSVPAGYTVSYQPDAYTGVYEVINTHIPETVDVSVHKQWDDNNDQDGIRPGSVELALYANGEPTGQRVTVTAEGNWSATFTGLAKYRNGKQIVYSVREVQVPDGYTVSYDGTTAINTHVPATVSVQASKVWNDNHNQDGIRPAAIRIRLYADGVFHSELEANADNLGIVIFRDLPKYANGREIVYTVQEAQVPAGYTATYSGNMADGFVITNTHEPEKTEITVSKRWDDKDDFDGRRPASIVVHLLANGEHTGHTLELSEANGWSGGWIDLDVYRHGTAINYTVYEEPVEGYTPYYSRDAHNDDHVIITNTYRVEHTYLPVQKVWLDNDDQDGIRPDSITVELYANGQPTGITAVLRAENHWRHVFDGLRVYEDGQTVTYTAVEKDVPASYEVRYELDALTGVYEIINTYTPKQISIPVQKLWQDEDDRDLLRPSFVIVELYADGVATGLTLQLSEENDWSGIWTGLPLCSEGVPVVYTVRETRVPIGYMASVTGTAETGFTVTNTHIPEKTQLTITKTWNDSHDQDGLRPDSITVYLYGNGELVATVQLTAEANWRCTLTGLNRYENGREIVYTISEEPVEGYETVLDGFHITNTHIPEKTHISVSKIWDDADNQDGKRPASIVVHLLADGVHTGLIVTLSAENNWSHTWNALNKYADGDVINYTVYEEEVEGYTATYMRDTEGGNHVVITNRYLPHKTTLTVQKLWQDNHNQDGIRPASVVVELYANGVATGITAVLSEENHWRYTFADLDWMSAGEVVVYTVVEGSVPEGYTVSYQLDAYTGVYEVINTHIPEETQLTITKTWDDNNDQDGLRPDSIMVYLYGNGELVATVQLTAEADWQYTLTGLNRYENGREIVYTISEEPVEGYETVLDGFHITNTHIPETVDVSVHKQWDDNNDQDGIRPGSVELALYADGEPTGQHVTVTAEGNWSATFTGLAKYRNGKQIVYSVREVQVPDGYTVSYDGTTAINTHVPNTDPDPNPEPETVRISVSKSWIDGDNQDGKRPASIVVHLLANGEHTGKTLILSADNGWSGSWTDLEQYHNGVEINYTVYEEPVEGYTPHYSRDDADDNHVIITNTYVPEKTALTVQKVWNDQDNQDGIRPDSITVELYANGVATGITAVLSAENHWRYTFENLDKMVAGEAVTYTAVEADVPEGYLVSYRLDAATGVYEVVNVHIVSTTGIAVSKLWKDAQDREGKRPDAVQVVLLANGVQLGDAIELSESNGWSHLFQQLPVYADGVRIVYTVQEINLPAGYTVSYSSEVAANGTVLFEITNTLVENPVEPPSTGDGMFGMFMLMIVSLTGVLVLLAARKKIRKA